MDMWKILKEVSKEDDKSIIAKLKDQNKTAPHEMASWGVRDNKIRKNCMACESLQRCFLQGGIFLCK